MGWMIWHSNPGRGKGFSSSSKCPDWLRAHISFLGVKWPGYDIDHSSPSRARAKNEWNLPLLPLYAFIVWKETTLPLSC